MRIFTILLTIPVILSACTEAVRHEVAQRIAAPAWMLERQINTPDLTLTAFERMHERHARATIYIGGPLTIPHHPQVINRTPENPVALHLASKDNAANIAYIASPCAFTKTIENARACKAEFSSSLTKTVSVLDNALNNIAARYDITEFHIVGYGNQAAAAATLAAQRDDIVTLRTVAGNFTNLDLVGIAPKLRHIPQLHFIGAHDEKTPQSSFDTYLSTITESPCAMYKTIDAHHDTGWVEQWPNLLKHGLPSCEKELKPLPALDLPEPIFYPRLDPNK